VRPGRARQRHAVSDSVSLVRYDAMCTAIAAAYEVDEAKDLRYKARAIEVYTRRAQNTEAERQACEIRLRAERRAGQFPRRRLGQCRSGRKETVSGSFTVNSSCSRVKETRTVLRHSRVLAEDVLAASDSLGPGYGV
jgi:hypothetical protein